MNQFKSWIRTAVTVIASSWSGGVVHAQVARDTKGRGNVSILCALSFFSTLLMMDHHCATAAPLSLTPVNSPTEGLVYPALIVLYDPRVDDALPATIVSKLQPGQQDPATAAQF